VSEEYGYIYVLKGGDGYYKIGRARDPEDRARMLGILMPWPVELLMAIPAENYRWSERRLHEWFAEKRTHGEWFKLDRSDIEMLWYLADEVNTRAGRASLDGPLYDLAGRAFDEVDDHFWIKHFDW
jgi:hypothetical protein